MEIDGEGEARAGAKSLSLWLFLGS